MQCYSSFVRDWTKRMELKKDTIEGLKSIKPVRLKTTNLEQFALENIFRPYQNMINLGDHPIRILPMKLDEIPDFILANPKWWHVVKDRIIKCNFYFPPYIKHRIINLIKDK